VNTTEQHLKRIQDKLQLLLKQHSILQKENQTLREQLGELKKQTEQYFSIAEKMKQQVEVLKYTNSEMDGEEKKQFEKRINGYIKEIDRCITMLSH
jgi:regulator of replication initiation timing